MPDIHVESWNELNERLYEGSWQEGLGRFRSSFAFRGMANARQTLSTSLMRLEGPYADLEAHLLRNFRKYAHHTAAGGASEWYWLALAQHHGLPTRLLDFTYSPYVALHFATADLNETAADAVVWCVDFVRANQLIPEALKSLLEEASSAVFTAEMLGSAAQGLREFDALAEEEFVVFLEPPSLDERIVNQFALFALMSSPTACLEHWLDARPELFRRVIIPAGLKWEVRDKLDQANITERVLLPGLDGLCSWLTRYYSPRNRRG